MVEPGVSRDSEALHAFGGQPYAGPPGTGIRFRAEPLAITKDPTSFLPATRCYSGARDSTSTALELNSGYNLIANPLDQGSNTVAEVLPEVPEGTRLLKFEPQRWPIRWRTVSKQEPGQTRPKHWLPVKARFFYNPSGATPLSLTFNGTEPMPETARQFGPGLYLISALKPHVGWLCEQLEFAVQEGDVIHHYDPSTGGFTSSRYSSGNWENEPAIQIGEGFFLERMPVILIWSPQTLNNLPPGESRIGWS